MKDEQRRGTSLLRENECVSVIEDVTLTRLQANRVGIDFRCAERGVSTASVSSPGMKEGEQTYMRLTKLLAVLLLARKFIW
jgi:hypothetical protein